MTDRLARTGFVFDQAIDWRTTCGPLRNGIGLVRNTKTTDHDHFAKNQRHTGRPRLNADYCHAITEILF